MSAPDAGTPGALPSTQPTRQHTVALVAAAGLGAVSNFVLMYLTTRTLTDPYQQSEALAFWSVLTGLFGVLVGVQNETTRATTAVRGRRARGDRLLGSVLIIAAVVAALVLIGGTASAGRVLPTHSSWAVGLLVLTALTYPLYALLLGAMAGEGAWSWLAGTLAGEVIVRLLAVVAVALVWRTLLGYEIAMAAAVVVMVVVLLSMIRGRGWATSWGDRDRRASLRHYGWAVISTSATAVMITGYPALMKASLNHQPQLAAWMLAVSITRAPVMMPIMTFQQVAVARFVERRSAPLRALVAPLGVVAGIGVLAAVGAGAIGPWLLRQFSASFDISGWAMVWLTLASAAMAALVLVGTAALAADGHRIYALGWAVGSVVSVVVLFALNGDIMTRVLSSLVTGPVVGCGLILIWLARQPRRSAPSTV